MKNKPKGSITLLIILTTATMLTLSLSCWHKNSLLFDLIYQREYFYKNFYTTESILQSALPTFIHTFDFLLTKKEKTKISLSPHEKTKIYFTITGNQAKQTLLISTTLTHQRNVCTLKCLLSRIKKGENDEHQKHSFELHHFTISTAL